MLFIKKCRPVNLSPPEVFDDTVDILIEGGKIIKIGKNLSEEHDKAETIDAQGKIVTPGLVCSHNHFYSALARGIIASIKPATDFVSILRNLWWRLDRALDEQSLYHSGLIGALEAVKAGTTAVIDHNASPSFIRGSLKTLKRSFKDVGLRGILCYEVSCRNGEEEAEEGVQENISFTKERDNLVEASIGAHAPFTLTERILEMLTVVVKDTGRGIHIHVAEDSYDPSYSHHNYGKDPLERLEDFGLLNEKAIIAHGVHLTEKDIKLLNDSGGFLVHNVRSNMNNGVGYGGNLHELKNVAIGTDGIGSNMLEEMKFAFFKGNDQGAGLSPGNILDFLHNGNRILSEYFGEKFGRIEKDYKADLVIWDYDAPTPLVGDNLAGHFIFGMSSRDVETVIIDGAVVYRDRNFLFDTGPIYREASVAAEALWKRMDRIH